MSYKVIYQSLSGHTKLVAEIIAAKLNVEATNYKDKQEYSNEIVFLGGAMYAAGISLGFKSFLKKLEADKIQEVYIFSTSGSGKSVEGKIRKILEKKNIKVNPISLSLAASDFSDKVALTEKVAKFVNN
jgi:flavodoxin